MTDTLEAAIAAALAGHGLNLYDLEVTGALVRVTVERPGGVDLEALAEANRSVSSALDALDPIAGRYTLELSSPGLERRLRTPAHFAGAVGEAVSVRIRRPDGAVERFQGTLLAADEGSFTLTGPEVPGGSAQVPYDQLDRARTVFEWKKASAPSPSRGKPRAGRGSPDRGAAPTERVTTP